MTAVIGMYQGPRITYDVPDADVCLNCPITDGCYPDSARCPIYGQQVIEQLARDIRRRDMRRAVRMAGGVYR